ncbi:hypothetical protein DYB25_013035 [Aphanomyces astaci]|uniref:Uncharacterized protein n=1 Tax=Aphanomyces astaci TaxID=112090 RepID=A0A397BUB7_APHAT|nr:hypothetical protein DYB25_013035 [Aphanomyces astaci]RHY43053.1 hypothetical protein DYB38_006061 [Aphanomyces astaci]RHY70428.1 hypothetical protein DYB30_006061 [Aphanomyces astaci]RHY85907.1 hypothetical protein DYB26_003714 [Aphanomyces astaci]RHZ04354.1 hypothetical protein DYB31_004519 [Aphanomyces astaci]
MLAYQCGIPHKLLRIVAAARVLQSANCPAPTARTAAAFTRHEWFQAHGVTGLRQLYSASPDIAAGGTFLEYASSIGNVAAVRYLLKTHHPIGHGPAVLQATLHGHLDVLRAFHDVNTPDGFTSYVLTLAAAHGHGHLVSFIHHHRPALGCPKLAMDNAAKHGHLDIVTFLHHHRHEGCTTSAMDGAAENGYLEVVKFLHAHRSEGCTKRAMDAAVAGGHMDIVRFLHENRREGCHASAMDAAAERGDFVMLQFLHWQRTEGCTVRALTLAAARGYLKIVDFLLMFRTEGCVKEATAAAAAAGHEDVVRCILNHNVHKCLHLCECPVEWPNRRLLYIGIEEAKAHGHWALYKQLKKKRKWNDRRLKWSQAMARAWHERRSQGSLLLQATVFFVGNSKGRSVIRFQKAVL